jgi:hypothetical protein
MKNPAALKPTAIALMLYLLASAVSSHQMQQPAPSSDEVATTPSLKNESSKPDDRSNAECALRVAGFIGELDKLLATEHSVTPIQQLLKKYFPLAGCNADEVLDLCRKSQYFSDVTIRPDSFIISFDGRRWYEHSGIDVQFGIDRRSGNSELPFVVIRM